MRKRFWWISFMSLLVSLVAGQPLRAQDVRPSHTDPGWQAMYWNNPTMAGEPPLQRMDPELNFNWGYGSPDARIPADRFSARWTRYIDVTPGNYRFSATSDDGMRVWIDGELLIDQWYDHAARTATGDKYLGPGHHLVQVDYYDSREVAVAQVSWMQVISEVPGWRGEYFNNKSLSGAPALVRNDANIDFAWGNNSPSPGQVQADSFSVRWSRTLDLPAGNYRFTIEVDDGARLFVNGHTLIDAWRDQPARNYSGDIYLPGGAVTVQMEYYDNTGAAVARLRWQAQQQPPPTPTPPPSTAVVVDDSDANFARGGNPNGWRFEREGNDGTLTWSKNNDRARANYNWGRWSPRLQPGRYEVFVFIPDRFTTTGRARYWVSHSGGRTLQLLDQSAYSNQWVSLGVFTFQGNGNDWVSLSDVTFEPFLSRLIAWDAVKWEPR